LSYTLLTTSRFERNARKLRRVSPDLASRIDRVLNDLIVDPFQPRLRLHALRGELDGLHAVSVTYSHRIILTLLVSEREIILLDIGNHDEVYR
jgi:mRNA-degrading endonuclease YafQ of YafQ-DinJ toxin-antitoxin module